MFLTKIRNWNKRAKDKFRHHITYSRINNEFEDYLSKNKTISDNPSCLFIVPDRESPVNSVHIGVSSIASYIFSKGKFDSHAINTSLFNDEEIEYLLKRYRYKYVFITMLSGQEETVYSISELIKNLLDDVKVVVGGPHVTVTGNDAIKNCSYIDYLVVGEGEEPALELLNGFKVDEIKGLIYRDELNNIVINAERPLNMNLDTFPIPRRDIYIRSNWKEHVILTSRGCPFKCNFCCSSKIWKHRLRFRSISEIDKELSMLVPTMRKDEYIVINDDMFNFRKERTVELCNVFRKYDVKYFARGIRADRVDAEIARNLSESGCMSCGVGIESVDNNSLKMMNKYLTFEQIERGCKLLMDNNIEICGQFIIGNIGDTLETVKKSIEFGKQLHVASFYPIYVLPGTALEEYVIKNNLMLPEPYLVTGLTGPRKTAYIFFETSIFPLEDRIKAIRLTDEAGFLT